MASEKTPNLYDAESPFEEKPTKSNKLCTKTALSIVLAALLIALVVALCVQFLVPVRQSAELDTFEVFEASPAVVRVRTYTEDPSQETTSNAPWHLDFLINPTRLCAAAHPPESGDDQKSREVELLILVPSAIDHFEQRNAIRNTWGSAARCNGGTRLGFVLGTTTNASIETTILQESEAHGDIIQADVEDTQGNLTTKNVLMLKWVSRHCAHARYFLKTEDDAFVNLDVVSRVLQQKPYQTVKTFIGGYINAGMVPLQKFFDYPEEEFPPYVSGSSYLTSGPTAADLFEACQQVQAFLPLQDAFVTGLCADQMDDATHIHEPAFRMEDPARPLNWDSLSHMATTHGVTPNEIELLWDQMNKAVLSTLNWAGDLTLQGMRGLEGPSAFSSIIKGDQHPFMRLFDFPESPSSATETKKRKKNKKVSDSKPSTDFFTWPNSLPESWKISGSNSDPNPVILGKARIRIHLGDSSDEQLPSLPDERQVRLPETMEHASSDLASTDLKQSGYVANMPDQDENPMNMTVIFVTK